MSSLRDRRRRQTAQDIQRAALSMALVHGPSAVTTEMIATTAGISQRTFFNYFPNKDAAIVGTYQPLTPESVMWFHESSGHLTTDLLRMLDMSLSVMDLDRRTLQLIDQLVRAFPDMLPVFYSSLDRLIEQIADLAVTRLGSEARPDAQLLATAVAHALADTMRLWSCDDGMPVSRIAPDVGIRLNRLRGLLGDCAT